MNATMLKLRREKILRSATGLWSFFVPDTNEVFCYPGICLNDEDILLCTYNKKLSLMNKKFKAA